MTANLLLRGLLAGLVAGLLAFGFARLFGEPQIDLAIAFEGGGHEHGGEATAGHTHGDSATAEAGAEEDELVGRSTQAGLGLLTALLVYGTAMGGLFALVFALVHGRVGTPAPRTTAALLALGAFLALVVVPDLKYPPNPPAVGNPDTIGQRTELFFVMLAASIVAMILAVALTRHLWPRRGGWTASIAGGLFFVVLVGVMQAMLPDMHEVPAAFSADLLWNFRIASIGLHLVLWTAIGLLFGALAERSLADRFSRGRALRPALR